MNTVFVVQDDCCGGCGQVHAVRQTREEAEAYIAAHQADVTHTLSIQDYELEPLLLQRDQRFWWQNAEWKLYGTVNECDSQAFMENRGHDEWGARNLHTKQKYVFYEHFLINELGFERPTLVDRSNGAAPSC